MSELEDYLKERGRIAGESTKKKHGYEHYRSIGQKSAEKRRIAKEIVRLVDLYFGYKDIDTVLFENKDAEMAYIEAQIRALLEEYRGGTNDTPRKDSSLV